MKYYFSLHNKNVENFWSDKTVLGGGVVLIAPDESHMLFKCDFVRRRNDVDCSVFKIELELNDLNKYVHDDHLKIKLANVTGNSNSKSVTCTSLRNTDDFDGNVEESYHYYHFAVDLKEKYKLTGGKHDEPVKSIKIVNILKSNGTTIEFSVFDEKMAFRPDGTIYYIYSVKIPDKYLESFYLEKNSFTKILYSSGAINTSYNQAVVVIMYRSINGPKGLKDSMGLEIRQPSLKNFWQPEAKPFEGYKFEPVKCMQQPYSKADSKINMMEVLKEMGMFESDNRVRIPEIKEVIFSYPATIVYWKDGTKTTVKCGMDEMSFDKEKAVAMCFLKKMFKPSIKSHWLDVINDAIQAADDKVAQAEADKAEKARIKAENIAKAEEARRKKAEKEAAANKIEEIHKKIKNDPPKSLEEMPEKKESPEPTEKKKIDQDLLLECIKEKLSIDEIAEMNSWDKSAVARLYYKITGEKPEKKNSYSEVDKLFDQGVSIDVVARRTGFSKNIIAMRYAKLQNKKNKTEE